MEWQVRIGGEIKLAIVPDEFVIPILSLLQANGVYLDPYKDNELGRKNIRIISAVLKQSWKDYLETVEKIIKQKICIRGKLPAWAEKMVQNEMKKNPLMNSYDELILLCEYALNHNKKIMHYGQ